MDFYRAGATNRERLFMAGNQLGKTIAGAMEVASHVTGLYQDWWPGRRFSGPTRWWVSGETRLSVRDTVQKLLVGPPERENEWGTGAIPGDCIVETTRGFGVANALDSLSVRHVTGGVSTILFKAYEQGRAKWQGDTLDGVWFDEEPSLEIYTEGLTRTNATDGMVFLTFTPLLGMSEVVRMFLDGEPRE
jgi:phage terminase large subunit-like protein